MYHGPSGGVGLDRLWPVDFDYGDWWILDFGFGLSVGLDRLWPMGLDRSWVLDFGFGIDVDRQRLEIMVIFFFLGLMVAPMVAPMVGFWLGLN